MPCAKDFGAHREHRGKGRPQQEGAPRPRCGSLDRAFRGSSARTPPEQPRPDNADGNRQVEPGASSAHRQLRAGEVKRPRVLLVADQTARGIGRCREARRDRRRKGPATQPGCRQDQERPGHGGRRQAASRSTAPHARCHERHCISLEEPRTRRHFLSLTATLTVTSSVLTREATVVCGVTCGGLADDRLPE